MGVGVTSKRNQDKTSARCVSDGGGYSVNCKHSNILKGALHSSQMSQPAWSSSRQWRWIGCQVLLELPFTCEPVHFSVQALPLLWMGCNCPLRCAFNCWLLHRTSDGLDSNGMAKAYFTRLFILDDTVKDKIMMSWYHLNHLNHKMQRHGHNEVHARLYSGSSWTNNF